MSKAISILYISYDGMTDALGQSQVLAYLTRLSKYGYNFTILSFEKSDAYAKSADKIKALIQGKHINWVPLSYTKRPPVLSTVYDLSRGWNKIKRLFKEHNFDIVHSRGGHIAAVLGLRCKKKYNCKYIFDMRGWWADEKKESGLWESPVYKPIYSFFKNIERNSFAESDCTISLTYAGKKEIVEKNYKEASKVEVIPTCVDFDVFEPFNEGIRAEVRTDLKIPQDATTLLYSGALGTNYNNAGIFFFYKKLLELKRNTFFLILSKDDTRYVQAELRKHHVPIENVRLINSPYSEVYKYLMAGDIGVILYKQQFSAIGRSPTKLGEYWACGLPALSMTGIGDLDALMEKYPGGGVLIKEMHAPEVQNALRQILESRISKETLRSYAKDYFDIESGVEKYHRIYQSISG